MGKQHGHGKIYNNNGKTLGNRYDYRNLSQIEDYYEYYEG